MPFTFDENERNESIKRASQLQGTIIAIIALLAADANPGLIAQQLSKANRELKELMKQFGRDATD